MVIIMWIAQITSCTSKNISIRWMKNHTLQFCVLEIYIMIGLAYDGEEFSSYISNLMNLLSRNVSLSELGKSLRC